MLSLILAGNIVRNGIRIAIGRLTGRLVTGGPGNGEVLKDIIELRA